MSRLHPTPTSYTPHPTPYTVNATRYTLHATRYTIHPKSYTLYPTSYTLHHTSYTLHPTPFTIHPTSYALHATRYTPHPKRYTIHPTFYEGTEDIRLGEGGGGPAAPGRERGAGGSTRMTAWRTARGLRATCPPALSRQLIDFRLHSRHLLTDVPPQPNSQPDNVFRLALSGAVGALLGVCEPPAQTRNEAAIS